MAESKALNQYSILQRRLHIVQSLEFAAEYLLNMKGNPNEKILFGVLTFFELMKLKVRIDKWQTQKSKHIFITESNNMEKQELEEEEQAEQFENEWNLDKLTCQINGKSVEDLKQELQEQLNLMRKGDKMKYNLGYQDIMLKSNKKMGIITTLPIPEIFKKPRLGKYSYRNIKKFIGEVLYLIRPVIYSILLLIYGQNSYFPYLGSLFIDLLRLILERDVEFYKRCERNEMKQRVNQMIVIKFYYFILLDLLYSKKSILQSNIQKSFTNANTKKTIQRKQFYHKINNLFN